jgi:hypothetical protein
VSGTISTPFLYSIYVAIAFVVAYFGIFIFLSFEVCRPLSTYWKQADWFWYAQNEHSFVCMDEAIILVSSAIISAVQDFIACGLPMILFWKLQIPLRQKFALGSIFAVGFL